MDTEASLVCGHSLVDAKASLGDGFGRNGGAIQICQDAITPNHIALNQLSCERLPWSVQGTTQKRFGRKSATCSDGLGSSGGAWASSLEASVTQ